MITIPLAKGLTLIKAEKGSHYLKFETADKRHALIRMEDQGEEGSVIRSACVGWAEELVKELADANA